MDENLSDLIVPQVMDLFPESTHVKAVNLAQTDDDILWDWAAKHGFAIVSKDSDFYQRSILRGYPPKFIYLQVGNCPTAIITQLLRTRCQEIRIFLDDDRESMLVLR
ncbi:MAG: DUF5615 family PIN-like protein [Phycisphaerales bacterium]